MTSFSWDWQGVATSPTPYRSATEAMARLLPDDGDWGPDVPEIHSPHASAKSKRQRFLCPFCGAVIVETTWPTYDILDTEAILVAHIRDRHPFRWRLSRKYRRAIRRSDGSHAKEAPSIVTCAYAGPPLDIEIDEVQARHDETGAELAGLDADTRKWLYNLGRAFIVDAGRPNSLTGNGRGS